MRKTPKSPSERTRAAAEQFAHMRPEVPVTFLDAQWQKAEAQCCLEDARREKEAAGAKSP